jgi:hypothetical protein
LEHAVDHVDQAAQVEAMGLMTARPELQPIELALRSEFGFGVESLLGSIKAVTAWDTRPDDVAETEASALASYLVELGIASDEAGPVVEFLTLRGEHLALSAQEPWEFSKRPHRLVSRPLIARRKGHVLVLPWWCEMAGRVYAQYLEDGRLPLPTASLPPAVQKALQRYRDDRNRELEDAVAAKFIEAGYRTLVRVDKPARLGLERLSGEIDVIAAVPGGITIWVIEVKDPTEPYSPAELKRAWDRFHGSDGWLSKLESKMRDLHSNPAAVASVIGADPQAALTGIVVTRSATIAGFSRTPGFRFETLSGIPERLELPG